MSKRALRRERGREREREREREGEGKEEEITKRRRSSRGVEASLARENVAELRVVDRLAVE